MKVEITIYSVRFESILRFTVIIKSERDLASFTDLLKRIFSFEEDLAQLQPAKKK